MTAQNTVQFDDYSPLLDAFGRLRVSQVTTLFDSKQILDNAPLFFDDAVISGTGTTSTWSKDTASSVLGVSANTAGHRMRQSFMRQNYQPGKSQLIMLTGTMKSGGGAGITRCMGYYDDDNGIFVKDNEGVIEVVLRSKTSGSVVETAVEQSNWNMDRMDGNGRSGIALDGVNSQIVFIDFEWLAVGTVRLGFVIDRVFHYVHEFHHANRSSGAYMSTPNLPVRYEIENDGTGIASEVEHVCCSVMTEGGTNDLGQLRYFSTEGVHMSTVTENLVYALFSIKLKTTHFDEVMKIIGVDLQLQTSNSKVEWCLMMNGTIAGSPSYVGQTNSSIDLFTGAGVSTNTITGGYAIAGGFLEAGAGKAGASSSKDLETAIHLGMSIAGVMDTLTVGVRPISGSNTVNIEGGITIRELT